MALCQYAWSTKTVPKALMTWGDASLGLNWHEVYRLFSVEVRPAGYTICPCMHALKQEGACRKSTRYWIDGILVPQAQPGGTPKTRPEELNMVRAEPPLLPAMGRAFAITVRCSQTCIARQSALHDSSLALSHNCWSCLSGRSGCSLHASMFRNRAIMQVFRV